MEVLRIVFRSLIGLRSGLRITKCRMQQRFLVAITLSLMIVPTYAVDDPIALENVKVNVHDLARVQRGARAFATYCLTCHALQYLDHDPIAKSVGITPNKMPDMNKKWWFGASPPDLSLIAEVHSANWLYTYLHSFYKDPARPLGTNNLLVDNVSMPNPFVGIQGEQALVVNKQQLFAPTPIFILKPEYYTVLELVNKGSMTSDEFDRMTADLVNFLVYASEPNRIFRERMGIWVLLFVAILFVLLWLLKKEYWRGVK
jgi:ubiquinol-cytochrome c reductase cytochrome c1 subunit